MDTTDPHISFDYDGVCNHCHTHLQALSSNAFNKELAAIELKKQISAIKQAGKGKRYDCVIGVSGGVDSTYVAWKVKELGLRPLAVHLDNGWNSQIAVQNIRNIVSVLDIDLVTYVIDWEEFRDIQRAFLLASVPDAEIPSDHAIIATLYQIAAKHGVQHVISGHNHHTESHLPRAWSQGHMDFGYIRDVHRRFGHGRIKTFPHLSFLDYIKYIQTGINVFFILDYLDYNKNDAVGVIEEQLYWQDYGGKHHESIFTRWYQGYYLLQKFNYDKRKSHWSSLISSGQATREQALASLQQLPCDEKLQAEDCSYIAKKLGFDEAGFAAMMAAPLKTFQDYNSYNKRIDGGVFSAARKVRKVLLAQFGKLS
jgi:N-acetyl sugar amidotransferase